ncbi:transcriptional regulator [Streptomyces sp. HSW2009]|uniref:transcriptional regulator n=1 Tax=Streptomyces sp. HSW2009 TaxID=3142890 RepID=UPI0032EDCD64
MSDIIRGERNVRGQAVIERICDGLGIPGPMLGILPRPWEPSGVVASESHFGSHFADPSRAAGEGSGRLDLVTVAYLRREVEEVSTRYAGEPSIALLPEVGRHLGTLVNWQHQTMSYAVRRDLHAATAETSTLMGKLAWDASARTDNGTARKYFRQAADAARELCDPVAEGSALLRNSFVDLYGEKNPRIALDALRYTYETVSGRSSILAGLAILHQAEAHAMLKQQRDCENCLADAEKCLEVAKEDDPGRSMASPGQFNRMAGSCFLYLDDACRAEKKLEATVAEVRSGSKTHAIVLGNLALAQLRQGNVDEAIHTVGEAISVVAGHRGGGGLNLIFRAGRELQAWNTLSGVRETNDRLFGLIASP